MKVIRTNSKRQKVSKVKALIKSAGNQIVGVTFFRRSDNTRRKMCCRFRVHKPQYAKVPSTKKMRQRNIEKGLVTCFDVNALRYNSKGRLCGRGQWKCFGLDSVERMRVNGTIYHFIT